MKPNDGITPEEQQRRRAIIERARGMVEGAGLTISARVLAQGERYVAGEIEIKDVLQKGAGEHDANAQVEGRTTKRCRTRIDHGPYIDSDLSLLDDLKPHFRDDRYYTEAEVKRLERSGVLKPEMNRPVR